MPDTNYVKIRGLTRWCKSKKCLTCYSLTGIIPRLFATSHVMPMPPTHNLYFFRFTTFDFDIMNKLMIDPFINDAMILFHESVSILLFWQTWDISTSPTDEVLFLPSISGLTLPSSFVVFSVQMSTSLGRQIIASRLGRPLPMFSNLMGKRAREFDLTTSKYEK